MIAILGIVGCTPRWHFCLRAHFMANLVCVRTSSFPGVDARSSTGPSHLLTLALVLCLRLRFFRCRCLRRSRWLRFRRCLRLVMAAAQALWPSSGSRRRGPWRCGLRWRPNWLQRLERCPPQAFQGGTHIIGHVPPRSLPGRAVCNLPTPRVIGHESRGRM